MATPEGYTPAPTAPEVAWLDSPELGNFGRLAPSLHARGWTPVPITPGTKAVHVKGWSDWCQRRQTEAELAELIAGHEAHGIGLAMTAELVAVDVDVCEPDLAELVRQAAFATLGPTALERLGGDPKTLLLYRIEWGGAPRTGKRLWRIAANDGSLTAAVELFAGSGQVVAYAQHPGGFPYRWRSPQHPAITKAGDLPAVTPDHFEAFHRELVARLAPAYQCVPASTPQTASIGPDDDDVAGRRGPRGPYAGLDEQTFIARAAGNLRAAGPGERHDAMLRVVASCLGRGWRPERVQGFVAEHWLDPHADGPNFDRRARERAIAGAIKGAQAKGWETPEPGNLPRTEHDPAPTPAPPGSPAASNGAPAPQASEQPEADKPSGRGPLTTTQLCDLELTRQGYQRRGAGGALILRCRRIGALVTDEHGDGLGREITRADGRTVVVPLAITKRPADLHGWLARHGVWSVKRPGGGTNDMVGFLVEHGDRELDGTAEVPSVATDHVGWLDTADGRVFTLPDDRSVTLGEATAPRLVGLPELVRHYKPKGTPEGWAEGVGALVAGNPVLQATIGAALAAPLLPLIGDHGAWCLSFVGRTTSGKTTAAKAGISVWRSPEGFVRWSSTEAGMRVIMAHERNTAVLLDELGDARPDTLEAVTYALSGGARGRATVDNGLRDPLVMQGFVLATAEQPLADRFRAVLKRTVPGGVRRRVVELDSTLDDATGCFRELHGHASSAALVRQLEGAMAAHYGHAGHQLLEALADDTDHVLGTFRNFVATATKAAPQGGPLLGAVYLTLAKALAGAAVGAELGLVEADPAELHESLGELAERWLGRQADAGGGIDADDGLVGAVGAIVANRTRFAPTGVWPAGRGDAAPPDPDDELWGEPAGPPVVRSVPAQAMADLAHGQPWQTAHGESWGYAVRLESGELQWHVAPEVWRRIAGHQPDDAARLAVAKGWALGGADHYTRRVQIGGARRRYVILTQRAFDDCYPAPGAEGGSDEIPF